MEVAWFVRRRHGAGRMARSTPRGSPTRHRRLAPEAGGNVYHSGGRQFASREDPDYRNLVQWINGATLAARARK